MTAPAPIRRDDTWVWPDGTTLPVISGGSDVPPAAPGETPPAEGAETPPAETPPPADAPAGDAPPAEDDFHALAEQARTLLAHDGDTIPVPRRVVEGWNSEAQRYRERWQPVERALSVLRDEDRQSYVAWVSDFTGDDPERRAEAVKWMRQVLGDGAETPPAGEQPPEFDPLDPASIKNLVDQQVREATAAADRERQIEQARQSMNAKARELGYNPDAPEGDAARAAYEWLLLRAKQYRGDPDALDKAHRDIEELLNNRATAILKQKGADATLPTAPPDGAPPSGRQQPRTLEDAEKAAMERLDKMLS